MKKKMVSMMLCAAMTAAMVAGCGNREETPAEAPAAEAGEETPAAEDGEEAPAEADAEESEAPAESEDGFNLAVEFDSIIPAINSGKADIGVAGMTVTEDRLVNVNFSDPYTTATQVIIVQEGSEIAGNDDLAGKTIGVQLGTTGDIFAEDVEGATIERYNKGMDAVQALANGIIDAVIIDNEPAKQFVSKAEGLKILDEEFVTEEYAIAIAKDNEELLEKVNTALEELTADGTIQSIIDKYITAE